MTKQADIFEIFVFGVIDVTSLTWGCWWHKLWNLSPTILNAKIRHQLWYGTHQKRLLWHNFNQIRPIKNFWGVSSVTFCGFKNTIFTRYILVYSRVLIVFQYYYSLLLTFTQIKRIMAVWELKSLLKPKLRLTFKSGRVKITKLVLKVVEHLQLIILNILNIKKMVYQNIGAPRGSQVSFRFTYLEVHHLTR